MLLSEVVWISWTLIDLIHRQSKQLSIRCNTLVGWYIFCFYSWSIWKHYQYSSKYYNSTTVTSEGYVILNFSFPVYPPKINPNAILKVNAGAPTAVSRSFVTTYFLYIYNCFSFIRAHYTVNTSCFEHFFTLRLVLFFWVLDLHPGNKAI